MFLTSLKANLRKCWIKTSRISFHDFRYFWLLCVVGSLQASITSLKRIEGYSGSRFPVFAYMIFSILATLRQKHPSIHQNVVSCISKMLAILRDPLARLCLANSLSLDSTHILPNPDYFLAHIWFWFRKYNCLSHVWESTNILWKV